MKKLIIALIVVALFVATPIFAQEKPTRLYTPVIRQADYIDAQTNETVWTPTAFESIVMDSWTISSNSSQSITLKASDTIVKLFVTASQPVVSPGGFLWKSTESVLIDTDSGEVSVTLTGWEETN